MRVAAGIMADSVEENFEGQGRPKWRSLAASTVRQRSKEGSWPGKILQRSGSLAQSVTRHSDATSATVGTNKNYAAIQHFGGQAGRSRKVTIPARRSSLWATTTRRILATASPGSWGRRWGRI
jgi:phage virion morphogenesis protein